MTRNKVFSDEFDGIEFGAKSGPNQLEGTAPASHGPVDEGDEPIHDEDESVVDKEVDDGGGNKNEKSPQVEPAEVDLLASEDQTPEQVAQVELPDGAEYAKKIRVKEHRKGQLRRAIWVHPEDSSANKIAVIEDAFASFEAIDPRDEFERMLAQQMIACHNAAMLCFRQATSADQGLAGWDKSLSHAEKLIATFVKLQDALNKHRGKGQQKVTVEHVHVYSGGQAVVGQVETGAKPVSADKQSAIEYSPEVPLGSQKSKARAKLKKKD